MITVNSRRVDVAEGQDESGYRYLSFRVAGAQLPLVFPVSQLNRDAKPLFGELGKAGIKVLTRKDRDKLLTDLQNLPPKDVTFRVATQLGWHGKAFVLPDETFGSSDLEIIPSFGDLDPAMLRKYRVRGSSDDWNERIGSLCVGNTRLMTAVCIPFAGAILALTNGPKTGGFQLVGNAEDGKTTAAMIAGSVVGCHLSKNRQGFIESWYTTAGSAFKTALAHNNVFLPLDESRLADGEHKKRAEMIFSTTFTLSEGTEKQRLTNQDTARSSSLYFLSTSNFTVSQLADMGRMVLDDAIVGRITDIPSPGRGLGIYEHLHGFDGGVKLTDALQARCSQVFGGPLRLFLRELVEHRAKNKSGLKKYIKKRRQVYLRKCASLADSLGLRRLNRTSGRFATLYAAGSLAIKYNALKWERGDLLNAILSCHIDGLQLAGASTSANVVSNAPSARDKLIAYLRQNKAKFMDLDACRPPLGTDISKQLGSVATYKGETWFYVSADQFRAIAGAGAAKALAKALVSEGLLEPSDQRPVFKKTKGNEYFKRVHAIRQSILDEQSGPVSVGSAVNGQDPQV